MRITDDEATKYIPCWEPLAQLLQFKMVLFGNSLPLLTQLSLYARIQLGVNGRYMSKVICTTYFFCLQSDGAICIWTQMRISFDSSGVVQSHVSNVNHLIV